MPQKAVKVRVGPLIPLLDLAMHRALPVMPAELLQFELLGHGFPVLGRRVIPTFALGALKRDDLSSLSRHIFPTGWSPRRDLNS